MSPLQVPCRASPLHLCQDRSRVPRLLENGTLPAAEPPHCRLTAPFSCASPQSPQPSPRSATSMLSPRTPSASVDLLDLAAHGRALLLQPGRARAALARARRGGSGHDEPACRTDAGQRLRFVAVTTPRERRRRDRRPPRTAGAAPAAAIQALRTLPHLPSAGSSLTKDAVGSSPEGSLTRARCIR